MREFKEPYYAGPCKCGSCEALREEGRQEMKEFVHKYMHHGIDYLYYMLTGGKDIYENDPRKKY